MHLQKSKSVLQRLSQTTKNAALAIGLLLVPASVSMAQAEDHTADNMHAFADIIRANADYQRALGEAQLNFAKSDLIEAQAAGEWQKARKLKLIVDRVQMVLRRLAQDEYRLRQKAQVVEEKARTAQVIMDGRITPNALTALGYLQINAVDPAVTFEVMTTPIGEISLEEFIPNGTLHPAPFTGDNLGQLIEYMRHNNQTVRPWGTVHLAIAGGLQKMIEAANARLANIQENLQKLGQQVNPFDLPTDGQTPQTPN